jgi:hypothetical protein
MSYCSIAEVRSLTGLAIAQISDTDMQALIDEADREINSYIAFAGNSLSATVSKSASIKLTICNIITQQRISGNKAYKVSVGAMSIADDPDRAIKGLRDDAYRMMEMGVRVSSYPKWRNMIRRTNK